MKPKLNGEFPVVLLGVVLALFGGVLQAQDSQAQDSNAGTGTGHEISITRTLPNSTQGLLWPPSEVADKDGNYIVVGFVLAKTSSGNITLLPNQAVIVDKNTVPPLDSNGREDFTNVFGAPYKIIRELDLRPGSPDLDIVLHTQSFGPVAGDVGIGGKAGPRSPRAGDSAFNLNSMLPVCPEIFPSPSQVGVFTRPSFPLHKVPIIGFQGDQVARDVVSGQLIDPHLASGPGCGFTGCPGENVADELERPPITLGKWLSSSAKVKITLTRFNKEVNAFTAAKFDLRFKGLLPRSMYTVWAIRHNVDFPRPDIRLANPLGIPSVFITDDKGNGTFSAEVTNPFRDPATDAQGLRVIGLAVVYLPGFQTSGACIGLLGPGVDFTEVFNTFVDGTFDFTNFITKQPPN